MESHSSHSPQAQSLLVCESEVREHKTVNASLQATSADVDMPQVGSFGQSGDSAFNSSQFNQSASSQFDQSASSQFSQSASSQFSQSTSSQFDQSSGDLSATQATSSTFTATPASPNQASSSFNVDPAASGSPPIDVDPDLIDCAQLAECLSRTDSSSPLYILIDSRSFIEYNSCHIQEALNVCCSKIIKRRLQNDKVSASLVLWKSSTRHLY